MDLKLEKISIYECILYEDYLLENLSVLVYLTNYINLRRNLTDRNKIGVELHLKYKFSIKQESTQQPIYI